MLNLEMLNDLCDRSLNVINAIFRAINSYL